MNTLQQSEVSSNMDKQAFRVFGGLALVVYSFALGYCYYTGHLFQLGVVATVMLLLGVLVFYLYSSIGKDKMNTGSGSDPLENTA